jgi:PAS domain S-box-containing protein
LDYLTSSYNPWGVVASVLIASFASYVTLDLAKRVRATDRGEAIAWWLGGCLAMGTGIWSMHFVGMLAFLLPIALGYTKLLTLLSWLAAVAASGIALWVASHGALTWQRLAGGSLVMGGAICAMHYIGMAALDMSPAIVWDPALIAGSAAIAVAASAAALRIFFWLREVSDHRSLVYQVAAALLMGLAISGMHYTGMAAASFPAGTVCLSANALGGQGLSLLVGLASVTMLAMTLFTSVLDVRMQRRTQRLASSLAAANAQLQSAGLEAQARFEAVFEHAPNGNLLFDRQRGIKHCNSAALKLFGAADHTSLIGRVPWYPPLSPEHQVDGRTSRECVLELMRRHIKSGKRVQSNEWRFVRFDGTPFEAVVSVIALEWKPEPEFCAVIEDVTARRQAETTLEHARDAAQASSQTKSSFLANKSHELRTPMNAIIGMTHLALEDGLPPKQRDYVEKAHGAARNLLQILNDILDISKIEAGHLELERISGPIDTDVGLAYCVGNADLYRRVLRGFRSTQADLEDNLSVSSSSAGELLHRLHDLMGLAGSIGAKDLQAAARALHADLMAGDRATVDTRRAGVAAKLRDALREIDRMLPADGQA